MAGLYIHIPFCKKACIYCDFHFSSTWKNKDLIFSAIIEEIKLRKDYLNSQTIETIYLGGGTPSILSQDELSILFETINNTFIVSSKPEITIEANPDDLTTQKIKSIKNSNINRFSIGVQSFFDEDLKWMNRSNTSQQSLDGIKMVQDAGFENISCDLIFGYPLLTNEKWQSNINQLINLNIPHISPYSLTIEKKTALGYLSKTNRFTPSEDDIYAEQYDTLISILEQNNYLHYEVSNFAKPNFISKHNSNYWLGKDYLGIGPSAHSFNGTSRQHNIANNNLYAKNINNKTIPAEIEHLSKTQQINELILTGLRTMWGLDLTIFESKFGKECTSSLLQKSKKIIDNNQLIIIDNKLTITKQGKIFTDGITSQLFY